MIVQCLLIVYFIIFAAETAYAYIDPGTGYSVFSIMTPILCFFAVILGFLIKPVIKLCRIIITIIFGRKRSVGKK